MLSIRPTHDIVYVTKPEVAEQSAGGIVLPVNVIEKENIGKVVAVGPGKTYSDGKIIPLTVKEGDEVIYSKFAGQKYTVDDKELIALREDDIYAIINR